MAQSKEPKLKTLPAKVVKENTTALEDIFLNANLNMDWIDSSYSLREAQLVDVAIATLAQYGNTVLLPDVFETEEMDHSSDWDARQMRAMTEIYALWVDKAAIINREDNLLVEPDKADRNWKTLFNYELTKLVLSKGKLMGFHRSIYSWEDWNQRYAEGEELRNVVAAFNLKEDHWGEFSGTFVTEDDSHSGFTCHVMYADGTFRDLRYEGTLGEVMKELG
jgi:hypothetical protein